MISLDKKWTHFSGETIHYESWFSETGEEELCLVFPRALRFFLSTFKQTKSET